MTFRVERWSVNLLDSRDRFVRPLTEWTGGKLEHSYFTTVNGSGSIDIATLDPDEISWGSARLQVFFTEDVGRVDPAPCGVYLVSAPKWEINDDTRMFTAQVSIMDKLSVLDQEELDFTLGVDAGEYVINFVEAVVRSTGETAINIEPSGLTFAAGMVWPPGTKKLQVVNDALASINYDGLWCDGEGIYRSSPYIEPTRRPIMRTFREGEDSLHLPEWEREVDWYDIPNKVIMVSQGDINSEALVATAVDTDLASPYSYPARGRWITKTTTGVAAADQATLEAKAQAALASSQYRATNLTLQHAMVGGLWEGDRVAFETSSTTSTATVSKWAVGMTPGSLVNAQWREVTRA